MTIRMFLEQDLSTVDRETRRERIQERKTALVLRGGESERGDSRKDKSTVKVVWKNVRKIRTGEKQMELDAEE